MKINFKTPREIEKRFNDIKRKINNIILQGHEIPSKSLFMQLDEEFEKIKKIYVKRGDKINLLHIEHNYLWSKAFEYLESNPTKSLSLFMKALSTLFRRHNLRPYDASTLDKMLKTYQVLSIRIQERKRRIDFETIKGDFLDFCQEISAMDSYPMTLGVLLSSFSKDLIEDLYEAKIDGFTCVQRPEVENLIKEINLILKFVDKPPFKDAYIPSLCYEYLYKLRKKELHCLVRSIFFEKSEEKKIRIQNRIDKVTDDMIEFSKLSFNKAKRFYSNLCDEKKKDVKIRLMLTLKGIDLLTAQYYKEAYSVKDILKAWKIMDEIKQTLVTKAFKENVPLSDNLLKYYGEEWSLLYVFAKISLLKEEVNRRISSLTQDWERSIFYEIIKSLGEVQKLFKYEMLDRKDYALKIITSSFAGSFSEYFLHKLCQEFFDHGVIDDKTPEELRDLLKCIKSAKHKEDIRLNDPLFGPGNPDIDIHIKGKCAIFLKNSKIRSDEMKRIWNEIELCSKNKISKVFYAINFIKNIENIEYVRSGFEKIKEDFKELSIDIFDIKDMISVIIDELKRCGKSELNFSRLDLYKVLDY